jgi:hypothetical protein
MASALRWVPVTAAAGRRSGVLLEGAVAGATGAAVVALWFLVQDLGLGVPFRTPALLGAALFQGIQDPTMVRVTVPLVAGYTLVHLAMYVAFGVAAAGLFALAERQPRVLFGIFMLFCCLAVAFLAAVVILAHWLVDELTPMAVLAANLVAGLAMVAMLLYLHRRLLPYARSAGE